ncbi:MAG TPA: 2-C-methyl-D-erythritol 2,4-cyclodiphosphate synthase [bacterium]|nr:2-C-methyl-D-erythritol 2,4-cyclodiphosphate synthase [bacterium]
MRVGIGYDVHKLVAGRKLFLGGVEIPHHMGLEGHSDADALIHAVVDALLGAAGEGDIGRHFPDTDMAYKDKASVFFLERARDILASKGMTIVNIDTVITAMEPRITPYAEKMRQTMAAHLGIGPAQINVKATTTEGLGFVGEKKGIAAYAIASLDGK